MKPEIIFKYPQIIFIALVNLLLSFLWSPYPIILAWTVSLGIFYGARKLDLVYDFENEDILWSALIVLGFLIYTILLIAAAFAALGWGTLILLCIGMIAIMIIFSFFPIAGEWLSGIIGSLFVMILMMIIVGGLSGQILGGLLSIIILLITVLPLPTDITPFMAGLINGCIVSVIFISLKILVGVLNSIIGGLI